MTSKLEHLAAEWGPYEGQLPFTALVQSLELPMSLAGEQPRHVVPSLSVSADGVKLTSIFVVFDSYLSEIVVGPQINFDFVDLAPLENYRVQLSQTSVAASDGKQVTYQIAEVTLMHKLGGFGSTGSKLTYAGQKRDEWLKHVTSVFPVSWLRGRLPDAR